MLIANKRKEIDWYNLRKTVEACAAEAQKSRLFESLFSVSPSDIQNIFKYSSNGYPEKGKRNELVIGVIIWQGSPEVSLCRRSFVIYLARILPYGPFSRNGPKPCLFFRENWQIKKKLIYSECLIINYLLILLA